MENPIEPSEAGVDAGLEALRNQVKLGLRLMVVFVWIVTLFIGRIAWQQHRSIQAGEMMTSRNQEELARMRAVVGEFEKYGVTNPGVKPVLEKYGIRGTN